MATSHKRDVGHGGIRAREFTHKLEKFQLADYQNEALLYFCSEKSFLDTRVLQIGANDLPDELKFNVLGAKKWFCIGASQEAAAHKRKLDELLPSVLEERSVVIDGDLALVPHWFEGQFDLIISVGEFEHVHRFPIFLQKAHAVLYKGGGMLAFFGPIWSGPVGHHLWLDENLNFNRLGPIGHWDHLLLRQPALYRKLRQGGIEPDRAAWACAHIYASDRINRLFYEDYDAYLRASDFSGFDLAPSGIWPIPAETEKALGQRYPGCRQFNAYGIRLNAWKLT